MAEKAAAVKLRKKGYSYTQIKKQIKVSKSTLSIWCRDVTLSIEQTEELLKRKLRGSEKGRLISAKKNHEKRIEEINFLTSEGKKEVGKLTKRDRFLIGIALYAGEGTKNDKQTVFSNSDPKLIKFMINWFREFTNISNEKIRGRLWIHKNRDELKAKKFWSELCSIPLEQFNKSYIAENKVSSKKIRKKIHEYGVFGIAFANTKIQRKILGWLSGIKYA